MKKLPKPQADYERELISYREKVSEMDLGELVAEFMTFLDYEQPHHASGISHRPTQVVCTDKEIMGPLYTLIKEMRGRVNG